MLYKNLTQLLLALYENDPQKYKYQAKLYKKEVHNWEAKIQKCFNFAVPWYDENH